MSELYRITFNPARCGGRPCLRGSRFRVQDVLDLLAPGGTWEEIQAGLSLPDANDIAAALEYAAVQSDHAVSRVT